MTAVSFVIPVYRAELTINELYRQLVETCEANLETFEIIFVEDCGGDESWALIGALAQQDRRVQGIKLSRNYGQQNALLCGIRAASHGIIVTMDDDLQHPVREIIPLLNALEGGFDVVYGTPRKDNHGVLRTIASKITKRVLKSAMGVESAANASAFRAFRTRLREGFSAYNSPMVSIDVLLTWSTTNFGSILVDHEPRERGKSGYSLAKLFNHAFNLITGFSTLPLRIASIVGFAFMFFGLSVLAYVLIRYFFGDGDGVPGFPFLASIIAIFSGVQLFALGIFGEYLARMYFQSMEHPPYVIQTHLTNGDDARTKP